jgi:hypothetical protein
MFDIYSGDRRQIDRKTLSLHLFPGLEPANQLKKKLNNGIGRIPYVDLICAKIKINKRIR